MPCKHVLGLSNIWLHWHVVHPDREDAEAAQRAVHQRLVFELLAMRKRIIAAKTGQKKLRVRYVGT